MEEKMPQMLPPDGFYESIWQWVDKYYQDDLYKDIYHSHTASFSLPMCLKEDWVGIFEQNSFIRTYGAFTTAIPDGRVCGDGQSAAVISQDNKLIFDVSNCGGKKPEEHWIFQEKQLPRIQYLKGNAAIMTTIPSWQHNYYHWMFDVMAKLDLFAKSGLQIDWYIINPLLHPFQYETLKLLGIPKEKIIVNHMNLHIQADHLVLASQPTLAPNWACQYLSTVLKQNEEDNRNHQKVYISRSDSSYRKVLNEEEVMEALKHKGFRIVTLSQVDLREQINIFTSAKLIVAPHGAGLTNLLFAKPGTRVIELFSPAYVQPIYWILSNRMGLEYYYMLGKGPREQHSYYLDWPEQGGDADIEIDIPKLMKILRHASIKT